MTGTLTAETLRLDIGKPRLLYLNVEPASTPTN